MRIYTKRGDSGKTSLIGGKRVYKSDLRIESYGVVDELNSWLGYLRDHEEFTNDKMNKQFDQFISIQDRLFTIGSTLATQPEGSKMKLPKLYEEDITYLEDAIDEIDSELPKVFKFLLPGGSKVISACHIARTICRKAERLSVDLSFEVEENDEQHNLIMKYLNRLSDYLFVVSRKLAFVFDIQEIEWQPKIEE